MLFGKWEAGCLESPLPFNPQRPLLTGFTAHITESPSVSGGGSGGGLAVPRSTGTALTTAHKPLRIALAASIVGFATKQNSCYSKCHSDPITLLSW